MIGAVLFPFSSLQQVDTHTHWSPPLLLFLPSLSQSHINTINRSSHSQESYQCSHKGHHKFKHLASSKTHNSVNTVSLKVNFYLFCHCQWLRCQTGTSITHNPDPSWIPPTLPHFLLLPDSSWFVFPLKACWLCSQPPSLLQRKLHWNFNNDETAKQTCCVRLCSA